jgi:hypothetical protein
MKQRRIIINNDFYNIFQLEPPISDQDVYDAIDRMAGTKVDTVFMMVPTTLETSGHDPIDQQLVRLYEHPEADPCIHNLNEYYASGKDPFAMLLERSRQQGFEFFASFRMNDTHYLDQIFNPWVPRFYYDNLHNRVGPVSERRGTEMDYRKSVVREYYLNFIRETVERYDVDGIEIDCTRNCKFFPPGDVSMGLAAEAAPILTDFVRQVRELLDEVGGRRGRKIELAVTIPGSLFYARQQGVDIPTWARLGYIDILCLSTQFLADFDRDIHDTRLKVPGVQIYAGCDRSCAWPGRGVPQETYRAMALNYLRQGADGIYLYNVMIWTTNRDRYPQMLLRHGGQGPSDYDANLMNEVGNIETLEYLDKLYLMSYGAESVDKPYASVPAVVPAGGEITLRMSVGDDIAKAAAANRIKAIYLQTVSSDCAAYNNYTVMLNGIDLSRQYAFSPFADKPECVQLFPEPNRSGALPAPENVRRHPVRPIDLHMGVNFITIKSYGEALTIADVELAIYYQ